MSKMNWWNHLLSYIMEVEIERVESEFGYDLSLCISNGRLQLNANQAIYSWEEKYDNFYKAFEEIHWDKEEIESVLVLGLGLASIPQMLEQKFNQNFTYTGVELDPEVIYLAEKYMLHQLKSSLFTIEGDAEVFVYSGTSKFDMICIDVFQETVIPKAFLTKRFLQAIADRLEPGGLLFFNHLTGKEEERKEAIKYFNTIFKKVFPDAIYKEVGGNHILQNRISK